MFSHQHKDSQTLKLITALTQHKALATLYKNSLPQWEKLSEYRCQMVVDQYENQDGQTAQQCRLEFLHKKNGSRFSINISDLSYVKNSSYLFEWNNSSQDGIVTLSDQVCLRMSANCLNYCQSALTNGQKNGKYSEKIKRQQLTTISTKSQYGKKSNLVKTQYLKKQYIHQANEIKIQQSEGSDFGSWIEQEFIQVKKKVELVSYKPPEKVYNDYRFYDDRSLIDYSQSTKINVRFKLLDFFKIKENRKKKLPQIKQFLRQCNYNVPDKPLKQLIRDLCVSQNMDRTKGYILKDQYLSKQELAQREEEYQREMLQKKEKDKKKRSKKQTKAQPMHESFIDSISQAKSMRMGQSSSKKKGQK